MKFDNFNWPSRKTPLSVRLCWTGLVGIQVLVLVIFYFYMVSPSMERMREVHAAITAHQKQIDELGNNTGAVMDNPDVPDKNKLKYLGNKVIFLEEQYGNVLNDIRQETNNHIEYINVWLGIWHG